MSSSTDYRDELRSHFKDQAQHKKLQTGTAQKFQNHLLSKQIGKIDELVLAQHSQPSKHEPKPSRSRLQPEHSQYQQQTGEGHHEQAQSQVQQRQNKCPLHSRPIYQQPLYHSKAMHHWQCCYYQELPREQETYRIAQCNCTQYQRKPPCRQGELKTNGAKEDCLIYENNQFGRAQESPLNDSFSGGFSREKSVTLELQSNGVCRRPQSQPNATSYVPQSTCNKAKLNTASQTVEGGRATVDIATCSNISENSETTNRSSKTVISRNTGNDLRKVLGSQIEIQNIIDDTLSTLEGDGDDATKSKSEGTIDNSVRLADKRTEERSEPNSLMRQNGIVKGHCCHCCITTPYNKQFADMLRLDAGVSTPNSNDPMTASLDEVVNTKVIYPMMRTLQHMYVNNLKEEMSLMDDLQRLPHIVREVYRASVTKKD